MLTVSGRMLHWSLSFNDTCSRTRHQSKVRLFYTLVRETASVAMLLIYRSPTQTNTRQTVPSDLSAKGYKNQLCVDFSQTVVDLMTSRNDADSAVTWKLADVRDMHDMASNSVDVAFDKGTLDAMIHGSPWSPPDEVLDNTGRYINEVGRSVIVSLHR